MKNNLRDIELDIINTDLPLVDTLYLTSAYTLVHSINFHSSNKEDVVKIQFISVTSLYQGNLCFFVDGDNVGEVFISKGITQLPIKLEIKQQLSSYFQPHFEEDHNKLRTGVQIKTVETLY
ncbi:hypothetical protein OR571_03405 [Psychrobacillus sp. NEAU-3TGS]|uniref:hypothetical protein n=1 Tax=Psychrobacillus sp. NEAU-3TGS TaxID=2995412 RepID=UPI002495C1EE|nr:hypothetical protein [Psychrobacillus sp. NEAU-3TGS]MDI2586196.1 hypothetical protein [Psychrobacillus sp. NEAU-3TGS]